MTLQIWTARVSYSGEDRLDITAKSASPGVGHALAPTVALLKLYHPAWGGKPDWEAYSEQYLYSLGARERSWVQAPIGHVSFRLLIAELLTRESVTLCCYCPKPEECHRTLAAKWLAERGGIYMGERPRSTKRGTLPGIAS